MSHRQRILVVRNWFHISRDGMKTFTVKGIKINVIGMDQASDQICFHLGAPKPFSGGDHGVIQMSSFHLLNVLKRQSSPLNFISNDIKGDAQGHFALGKVRAGIQVCLRLHSELFNPGPCAYLPDHLSSRSVSQHLRS